MKNAIEHLADKARSHIAQLAALRFILKAFQTSNIINSHMDIAINTPENAQFYDRYLNEQTQEMFAHFKEYYSKYEPYDPGHCFNKSAVLLADATIQKYLKELYKLFQPELNWPSDIPMSLSSLIRRLFVGNPRHGIAPLLSYDTLFSKFEHMIFLDQLRHVIIHNQGIVDEGFYKECGIDPDSGLAIPIKPDLWGLPSDWNDPFFKNSIDEFRNYFVLGKQIGLPINKVLGMLRECTVFIDDVEAIFKGLT